MTRHARLPHALASHPFLSFTLVYLAVVILFWMFTGWTTGLTSDAWHFYYTSESGLFRVSPARPLVLLVHRIGALLFPDTLAAPNIMLAIMLWARSLLVYGIGRVLGFSALISGVIGLFTLVLTIDTGVFYLGGNAVYFSGTLALAAVLCLLLTARNPRPLGYTGMAVCILLCTGIYEASYPILLAAPLLLFAFGRVSRRMLPTVLVWYGVLMAWLAYVGFVYLTRPEAFAYQTNLVSSFDFAAQLGGLASAVARHVTLSGWLESTPTAAMWGAAALAAVVCGAVAASIARTPEAFRTPKPSASPLRLAVLGVCVIVGGLLVYAATDVIFQFVRTSWVSTVGAACLWTALIWGVYTRLRSSWGTRLFAVAVAALTLGGVAVALAQRQVYADHSNAQQRLAAAMVAAVPGVIPGTAVAVYDATENERLIRVTNPVEFPDLLATSYGVTLESFSTFNLCSHVVFASASTAESAPSGSPHRCMFYPEYFEIWLADARVVASGYEALVFVRYETDITGEDRFVVYDDLGILRPGFAPAAYAPDTRIDMTDTRARGRAARLFGLAVSSP
jgi:hypothetical protein